MKNKLNKGKYPLLSFTKLYLSYQLYAFDFKTGQTFKYVDAEEKWIQI